MEDVARKCDDQYNKSRNVIGVVVKFLAHGDELNAAQRTR
jgi:hypothetical protein